MAAGVRGGGCVVWYYIWQVRDSLQQDKTGGNEQVGYFSYCKCVFRLFNDNQNFGLKCSARKSFFFSVPNLGKTYLPNLSHLLCLEVIKKIGVWLGQMGGGGLDQF